MKVHIYFKSQFYVTFFLKSLMCQNDASFLSNPGRFSTNVTIFAHTPSHCGSFYKCLFSWFMYTCILWISCILSLPPSPTLLIHKEFLLNLEQVVLRRISFWSQEMRRENKDCLLSWEQKMLPWTMTSECPVSSKSDFGYRKSMFWTR